MAEELTKRDQQALDRMKEKIGTALRKAYSECDGPPEKAVLLAALDAVDEEITGWQMRLDEIEDVEEGAVEDDEIPF